MNTRPGDMLTDLCSNAHQLVLAAPYIKANALSRILDNVAPDVSLTCVARWSPHDIALGVSDTECRTIINLRGGSFRLHPTLHAKYYRVDDVVLVGSANLTYSAMGWSSRPNLEILCLAGSDFDADTFQQELMENSREISDAEFTQWESIASINARIEYEPVDFQPILDTWIPTTRAPIHIELVYSGREDSIASPDEQYAAKRDIQALMIPPNLTSEQIRTWVGTCLLSAPFTNTVIQLHGVEAPTASRSLADTYDISLTEARRGMEAVHNWLSFFSPEIRHDV